MFILQFSLFKSERDWWVAYITGTFIVLYKLVIKLSTTNTKQSSVSHTNRRTDSCSYQMMGNSNITADWVIKICLCQPIFISSEFAMTEKNLYRKKDIHNLFTIPENLFLLKRVCIKWTLLYDEKCHLRNTYVTWIKWRASMV